MSQNSFLLTSRCGVMWDKPGLGSKALTVWPHTSPETSLSIQFLTCEPETIIPPLPALWGECMGSASLRGLKVHGVLGARGTCVREMARPKLREGKGLAQRKPWPKVFQAPTTTYWANFLTWKTQFIDKNTVYSYIIILSFWSCLL